MRCSRCGAWVDDNRTTCGRCGAPVASAARQQRRQRTDADAQRGSGTHAGSGRSDRERQSYGRALDARDRQSGSSDRRGDVPFRPAYQPEEPKRPKGGIILAIVVIVAIVLIVLFWFPGVLKGCGSDAASQTGSTQGQSGVATSSSTSSGLVEFDADKAEAAARDAALDADKQVFTGTVRVTTLEEEAAKISDELAAEFASSDGKLVLLELADSPSIEARSADDASALISQPDAKSIRLDDSYSSFDGKEITIAVHAADMTYPNDATGELYTVTAENIAIIAPLTENTAEAAIQAAGTISKATSNNIASIEKAREEKAKEESEAEAQHQAEIEAQWQAEQEAQWQAQQAQQNNYYIIPDSSSRYLSRSELEGYSTYDLYLARNEIYARYGRLFVNQDLQDYFWSQAWYNGYIAPESFGASWMSDVDRKNATLMRQIEEERNSPYL